MHRSHLKVKGLSGSPARACCSLCCVHVRQRSSTPPRLNPFISTCPIAPAMVPPVPLLSRRGTPSLHVQSVLLGPKMRLCCLLSPSNQKLGAADWERILYVHWLQAFRSKPFIFSGLLAKTKNFINRSALQGTVGLPNYLYKKGMLYERKTFRSHLFTRNDGYCPHPCGPKDRCELFAGL